MDDYRTPADSRRQEESLRESGVGGASAAYDTSKGGPQESYGGTAPSYAQTMGGSGARSGGSENENPSYAPHGKSIQEGGFDSSAPNASFTTDIGGKNDPGRLAENQMSAGNARIGEDAGYPGANVGADGGRNQGGFERLSDDTNA